MRLKPLSRPLTPWAWALVLALLWLTGWGQVHKVLHPQASMVSAVATSTAAAAHDHGALGRHVGHEAGGQLCLLLDHLAEGSAPAQGLVLLPAGLPTAQPLETAVWRAAQAAARLFDAQGPPFLA